MRYLPFLLAALLLSACSSKMTAEERAQIITRNGVIAAKEDASVDDVERATQTRGRTSVYGSVSSGGGVSIGLGFLLSSIGSGGSTPQPVRYEIDFVGGGQMTIYHDSRDFEVGDCVEISAHPDEKKYPPKMRRNKGGCDAAE